MAYCQRWCDGWYIQKFLATYRCRPWTIFRSRFIGEQRRIRLDAIEHNDKNRGVQHCTPTKSLWKNRPATKRAGEKMGRGELRFINRRAISMFRSGFHFKITERMTRLGT